MTSTSNIENNETRDKVRVENSENEVKNEVKNSDENSFFKYVQGAETLYFKFITSKRVECPICKRDFKNIISHLKQSKCAVTNLEDFREKFFKYRQDYFKEEFKDKENQWKSKSRIKMKNEDPQKVLDDQKRWQAKSQRKKKEENLEKELENQKTKRVRHLIKSRDTDPQKVLEDQRKWQRLSRKRKKIEDPKGLSRKENEAQKKKRKLWTAMDRLKEFKEATKYNAIFICSCCHRRLFESNVEVITEKLKDEINTKKCGHFLDCIEEEIVTPINGKNDCYICKTCIGHMKARNIPPMSVRNNLSLEPQDEDLQLTELEGALISKNLIFQKIFQLPKSRWTALKDKIINVPINDEDILNTVESLPRTPHEAALIGISLKRKLEYKNTHKRQLINPKKIIRMLDKLKKAGNPHYQFHDDLNT